MAEETPRREISQVAVVPYLVTDGVLEIGLITSLKRRRWTIPKGIIEPHLGVAESAILEAYEEAGLRGTFEPGLLGTYSYPKWGAICRVEVYPMRVTEVLDDWPEVGQRKRRWATVKEALVLVGRPEVCGPIRKVAALRSPG